MLAQERVIAKPQEGVTGLSMTPFDCLFSRHYMDKL